MRNPQQLAYLTDLVRRADGADKKLDTLLSGADGNLESVGGGLDLDRAADVLEGVRNERPVAPGDARDWEAIVNTRLRPSVPVVGDTYESAPFPWGNLLEADTKAILSRAARAVGRIEPRGYDGEEYIGTGFLVGGGLLVTNRHVAAEFVLGVGTRQLEFFPGQFAAVDMAKERFRPSTLDRLVLTVVRCRMIHPFWDVAVLQVEGLDDRPLLQLATAQPEGGPVGRQVAVIGFPARDWRNDAAEQERIFGLFGDKQILPGEIRADDAVVRSFGNTVTTLMHDCSTLGGNSGSPVIDLKTGQVVGVHFAGRYLVGNYAVPAWQLALDQKVVDLGVFEPSPPPPRVDAPPWVGTWAVDEPDDALPEGFQPGWFEHTDAERLQQLAREDEATLRKALRYTLGAEAGDEVMAGLRDEEDAELIFRKPDPNLPIIVYLHGIMGGHIKVAEDRWRLWLGGKMLGKAFIDRISMAVDGVHSVDGSIGGPDGHLNSIYLLAALKWRAKRFEVHSWSFDWRRSVLQTVDRLDAFLRKVKDEANGRRIVLVGHSMGGLVSSTWAAKHEGHWKDLVEGAVFMGSPLGGAHSVFSAMNGRDAMLRNIAKLTPAEPEQMSAMARSLPGLVEMLPDPVLFPDAAPYYKESAWPRGQAPAQALLDRSIVVKQMARNSPLLEHTTLLIGLNHPTSSRVGTVQGKVKVTVKDGVGDGTVPAASAFVDGVRTGEISAEHAAMPLRDAKAVRAVAHIFKGKDHGLSPVKPEHTRGRIVQLESVETEPPPLPEATLQGVRERAERDELTAEDILWVLTGKGAPPRPAAPRFDATAHSDLPSGAWTVHAEAGGALPWKQVDPVLYEALGLMGTSVDRLEPWTLVVHATDEPAGADKVPLRLSVQVQDARPHDRLVAWDGHAWSWVRATSDGAITRFELPVTWAGADTSITVAHVAAPRPGQAAVDDFRPLVVHQRLRSFTPDDRASLDPEHTWGPDSDWARLSSVDGKERRVLLLVHGGGRQTHDSFGQLSDAAMTALSTRYGGRILAFDHLTLTEGVMANVGRLADALPTDRKIRLVLDVVGLGSGGLIGRVLAEGHAVKRFAPHKVEVRELIFVGTPNGGTRLVDPALWPAREAALALSDEGDQRWRSEDELDLVVAMRLGSGRALPGDADLLPGSALLRKLWEPGAVGGGLPRYHAVAATWTPPGDEPALAAAFEGRPNDLFVLPGSVHSPTDDRGEVAPPFFFPIPDERRLRLDDVPHHRLLADARVQDWIVAVLASQSDA